MSKISRWINDAYDKVWCPHDGVIELYDLLDMAEIVKSGLSKSHVSQIHPLIASVFDAVRDWWGDPIIVTAGIRCQAYQHVLKERGYRTAAISPHVYGVALDIIPMFDGPLHPAFSENKVPPTQDTIKRLANAIHKIDPDIRIFTARYDFKFIHMDCAYLLSDPLPDDRPRPASWKAGVRDWPC